MKQTSSCPQCGAPIYNDGVWTEGRPPQNVFSCACSTAPRFPGMPGMPGMFRPGMVPPPGVFTPPGTPAQPWP